MRKLRILLADDHHVVRKGLRDWLEAEPDIEVVAEAVNGLDAVRLVERHAPDVLVVDVLMPGLSGLEVIRQVGQRAPRTRILVLSMHADEGYVIDALRHGAAGYAVKDSPGDELVRAVRQVAAGRTYLAPALSERAVAAYVEKARERPPDPFETLTTREREVMQLAAEGWTNREIAERLSISPRTVESFRARLMRKLDLRTQTDLIRYAIRRGMLPPD